MIKLNGITWQNPRGFNPLVASARAWQEGHPDVEIVWTQQPWYQFEQSVLRSLEQATGEYDLIMFDHPWTGTLAEKGWLVAWEALTAPDYLDDVRGRVVAPSLESYEWGGQTWALPLDAACHAALVRSDLVDADALPRTWEDMAAWAQAHHNPPERYGVVLLVEGVLGACLFASLMAGLGKPAFHDPADPSCDREAAAYVLDLLKRLIAFTPPGSTHWGPWDIYDHLCSADDVGYSPSIFAYVNYFTLPHARGAALRLRRVPDFAAGQTGRAILGGVGLGVAHTCPHPGEAAAYGQFLMSDAVQKDVFTAHQGQPAAWSAWRDPEVNRAAHNFYHDLAANMDVAYIRPRHHGFHELELEMGRVLQGWWDDRQTLDETLDGLRAR